MLAAMVIDELTQKTKYALILIIGTETAQARAVV